MEQTEDKHQEVSELKSNFEESVVHKVKTVSDGSKCNHNYMDDYIDPEGKQHQQCSNCYQGRWK